MEKQVKKNILTLVQESRDAIACSVDQNGFPNAKAMFIAKSDGIQKFWFSTNTSAGRTKQWMEQPEACIYILDADNIQGLMLIGTMTVLTDEETKEQFWNEGDEKYYSLGVTDPDYCIVCFTSKQGKYWENQNYDLDEALILQIK
ncbi:MAG: hypothetical protein PWP24_485 [Clostridiales bacterium]|nr:hypothetical protein [Clostridiales bacterium]